MASGGYDFEVVGDLIKEYECPICLLLIRDANTLPCSHTMCQTCIVRWEEGPLNQNDDLLCPACKVVYEKEKVQRVVVFDRIITNSLKVKCKKHEETCDWIGTISDFQHHEENQCLFTLIMCDFDGCDVQIERCNIQEHKLKCNYRLVNCQYCNLPCSHKDLQEHLSKCISYPIHCPNKECGLLIKKKEIEEHLQSHCEYEIISCTFHTVGCKASVKRREEEQHLNSSTQFHMGLLLKHTTDLSFALKTNSDHLETTQIQLKASEIRLKYMEEKLEVAERKLNESEIRDHKKQEIIEEQEKKLKANTLSLDTYKNDVNRFLATFLFTVYIKSLEDVKSSIPFLNDDKFQEHNNIIQIFHGLISTEETSSNVLLICQNSKMFNEVIQTLKANINCESMYILPESYKERYKQLIEIKMESYKFYSVNSELYFKVDVDIKEEITQVNLLSLNNGQFKSTFGNVHMELFRNENFVVVQKFEKAVEISVNRIIGKDLKLLLVLPNENVRIKGILNHYYTYSNGCPKWKFNISDQMKINCSHLLFQINDQP